jgi:hypothetical protein
MKKQNADNTANTLPLSALHTLQGLSLNPIKVNFFDFDPPSIANAKTFKSF